MVLHVCKKCEELGLKTPKGNSIKGKNPLGCAKHAPKASIEKKLESQSVQTPIQAQAIDHTNQLLKQLDALANNITLKNKLNSSLNKLNNTLSKVDIKENEKPPVAKPPVTLSQDSDSEYEEIDSDDLASDEEIEEIIEE